MNQNDFSLQLVTPIYPATLLVEKGSQPCLVQNLDLVNTVWVGDNAGIEFVDSNSTGVSPIGPLGQVIFSGQEDVYAICQAGTTANVAIYPTALGVGLSPSLIAEQIALAGVSILAGPVSLYSITGQVITQGSVQQLIPVTAQKSPIAGYAIVNQLGYELNIQAQCAVGATIDYVQVDVQFFDTDSLTAIPVDITTWWIPVARAAATAPTLITGKGPMRGLYMNVVVTNPSPGFANLGSINWSSQIYGNGRTYPRDDWRENTPAQILSVGNTARPTTWTPGAVSVLNIGNQAAPITIAAGNSIQRVLPLISGRIKFRLGATGLTTNQMGFHFYPQNSLGNAGGGAANPIDEIFLGVTAITSVEEIFPHDPVNLFIQNNSGVPGQVWVAAVLEEY